MSTSDDAGAWAIDRHVNLQGLAVRYRDLPGDDVPLLLINGIGASMEMWTHFVRQLDGRRVIALDLPGSGESQPPMFPVGMSWFANRVALLLDELGLDEVDTLGFSFGGAVAQQFALDHPARVRRLVLAATTPGVPAVPGSPMALLAASTPLRYLDPAWGALLVPHMVGGRTMRDSKVLMREMPLRQEIPPTWWGYLTQLGAIAAWSSHAWVSKLTMPTLVIHGDDDRLCPVRNARWVAQTIPDCRYEEMAGAGHLLLLDEAPTAAAIITDFLDAGNVAVTPVPIERARRRQPTDSAA